MEIIDITAPINTFGFEVERFPMGIKAAFDTLSETIEDAENREMYGISECIGNKVQYIAAAAEQTPNEKEKNGYNSYTIAEGKYLSEKLINWPQQTDKIKDILDGIYKDERCGINRPAIEVYTNMQEMHCMVKMYDVQDVIEDAEYALNEFISLLDNVPNQSFNTIPFEGSWTPGQLGEHVRKSIAGFDVFVNGPGKPTQRNPYQNIPSLKSAFLNYDIKMHSPESVKPDIKSYDQESLVKELSVHRDNILQAIPIKYLKETCTAGTIPVIGELTRMEAVYFAVFHTTRHSHQLRKMLS